MIGQSRCLFIYADECYSLATPIMQMPSRES